MDKVLGKFEEFWRRQSNIDIDLWKAVARSYIEKDQNLEEQQIFITQISFYPNLIDTLIKVLKEKAEENSEVKICLDITFFSTLLPRHYWNFPLEYKDENNVCIDAPDFLDTYRESIENCVNTNKGISVKIERILVITSGEKRKVDGNTILFCNNDLNADKQYLIPDHAAGKINWTDFIEKDKIYKDQYLIDIKDLTKTTDIYKNKKNKTSRIYLLQKSRRQIKRSTLYDYYIEKLHSEGGARQLVVYPQDALPESVCKKCGSGKCLEGQFDSVSPNLSIIKIKIENNALPEQNKELAYVLDTYMDLRMGIVKLQIWNLEENEKLKGCILDLCKQSKEMRNNIRNNTRYARNKLKSLAKNKDSYLDEIRTTIQAYINGPLSREIKDRGNYILKNIGNESSEQLQKYYELQQNKDENDFIQEVSQQMGYKNR